MGNVQVRFLGSGDALGSGGRFQACILVASNKSRVLLDCGASSLIPMRRFGVDPNLIDAILISHLHGDHFGGLPFFVLDAQFISKRVRSLVVAGPPGTRKRVVESMEVLFPGLSKTQQKFSLEIVELVPETPTGLCGLTVTPYVVEHACGDPPFALRIECDGKTIAYTGDTAWTDALISAAKEADLLIAEAYFFDKPIKFHLDFQTLMAHVEELRPKRLVLTHMSQDMLARLGTIGCEYAEDGKVVEL